MIERPGGTVPFDTPPPGTFDAIFAALDACSRDLIGPMLPRLLVIPIHDDAGAVAGGFWGCTLFRWLHVQLLFIPEPLRGLGFGARLMRQAETEARNRGCIGAHVSSFSFQATPFYQKLGYTSFGRLDDYPPGHTMAFLSKRFDAPTEIRPPPLTRARALACQGEDEAAKQAYVEALQLDPTSFPALNELAVLAVASGHRSAARSAWEQAVRCHPNNPIGHVNLGDLLFEDGEGDAALAHYEAALAIDPGFPAAHQGLARVLDECDGAAAELHRREGFTGHAVVSKPYRGKGKGVPLLLLVAARGGNIPTRRWIDDRRFAVTAIHTEFHDLTRKLPPHDLVVNAIGDADRCGEALARAESLLEGDTAPLINAPALVLATGRVEIARRLACIPGVVTPEITALARAALLAAADMRFPLLLRSPGFHTGRHFRYVADRAELADAVAALPGECLLAIQYLDARGRDGMARKYRVMCIDGALYPVHLAVAAHWKVHYFTAAMAANQAHRDEERAFLDDMKAVLGSRAMTALTAINDTLGLDYAGIDFALDPDGSVMVFEANATMVINPPGPEPIWDYRRRASAEVTAAAANLLTRRAASRWRDNLDQC